MRRGFTLTEMLVVLAVVLTLAAVILPHVAPRARDATATAAISTLTTAADAIGQFKADTRRYPGRLQWLSQPSGSPVDICGNPIPGGLLARWAGPYIQRQVVGTGIPAGDALVLDVLERADPASTPVSTLVLRATGLTATDAERIEAAIDGNDDLDGGAVRWVDAPAPAPDTLYYHMPIRGC
jgi:prepilin-type N-terminal cleavage/methylation domain-containing protein